MYKTHSHGTFNKYSRFHVAVLLLTMIVESGCALVNNMSDHSEIESE